MATVSYTSATLFAFYRIALTGCSGPARLFAPSTEAAKLYSERLDQCKHGKNQEPEDKKPDDNLHALRTKYAKKPYSL